MLFRWLRQRLTQRKAGLEGLECGIVYLHPSLVYACSSGSLESIIVRQRPGDYLIVHMWGGFFVMAPSSTVLLSLWYCRGGLSAGYENASKNGELPCLGFRDSGNSWKNLLFKLRLLQFIMLSIFNHSG